ncbi:diacylglycerol kinase [Curvibacter sp. APW13]|uniref:diacylglycerol kinase n=1 Tax=Curvibacter sp. APW13 TaxID=3077236 RepID=UPI0028DF4220|nr:diacylglycerol kinase [Curvibacter sp. APW13]MDT8992240.1 diacylglycerol kinase [Curvibacter sp. APW13]
MQDEEVGAQKQRTGLIRWWHATRYSLDGLKAGWHETAFRQEALACVILAPTAMWLGSTWVERSLLLGSVLAVLVVELLNTALESTVDRFGSEWHALAKRAKDMGSAAVLLTLLWCTVTWVDAVSAWLGSR